MRSMERAGVDSREEKVVDVPVVVEVVAVAVAGVLSALSLRVCVKETVDWSLSFRFWFLLKPKLYDAHGSSPAESFGAATGVSGVSYCLCCQQKVLEEKKMARELCGWQLHDHNHNSE